MVCVMWSRNHLSLLNEINGWADRALRSGELRIKVKLEGYTHKYQLNISTSDAGASKEAIERLFAGVGTYLCFNDKNDTACIINLTTGKYFSLSDDNDDCDVTEFNDGYNSPLDVDVSKFGSYQFGHHGKYINVNGTPMDP